MNITILLCAVIVLLVLVILIPSKPKLRSAAAYWQKIGEGVPLGLNARALDVGAPETLGLAKAPAMDLELLKRELEEDPLDLRYRELGQDYAAICEILNAVPMLPNPVKQGRIPKQYTLTDFLAAARNAEAMAIVQYPALVDRIERAVDANNRPDMTTLFGLIAPLLSDETQRAIALMLADTEPDPAYSATVAGTSRAADIGLPPVKATDLQMFL